MKIKFSEKKADRYEYVAKIYTMKTMIEEVYTIKPFASFGRECLNGSGESSRVVA